MSRPDDTAGQSVRERPPRARLRRSMGLWRLVYDRQFLLYSGIGAFIYVLNVALLYLFIDILGVSTVVSSSAIIAALFILKYILYRATGFSK